MCSQLSVLRTSRLLAAILALILISALLPFATRAAPAQVSTSTYTNPVSPTDTFADPSIIRAKDGYWYSYATTDAVLESKGDSSNHYIPMARSKDLVHWTYIGDAFSTTNHPTWITFDQSTYFWAPDIRYFNGKYYMYYAAVHFPEFTNAVGVATAPTPAGPWTDSGAPVVRGGNGFTGLDPAEFTDKDGSRYLYYGSFNEKGIAVIRLTPDGLHAVGEPKQVVRTGEAPYLVRKGGYYYLMFSDASCCNGELSGYIVYSGRSTSPMGPFVDRDGVRLDASRMGGTFVVAANGNKWVGPGHNSVTTDLAGQDWFVYHLIDRNNPNLNNGAPRRPLGIDRLDWINGWPMVRAGAWASDAPQTAPVTEWTAGSTFNGTTNLNTDWKTSGGPNSAWKLMGSGEQTYVHNNSNLCQDQFLITRETVPVNERAEGDLRLSNASPNSAAGLVFTYHNPDNYAAAWLDKSSNSLVTDVHVHGESLGQVHSALPAGFDFGLWHNIAAEVRDGTASIEVTDSRQFDPQATQERMIPTSLLSPGSVGVVTRCGATDADNVGAVQLYTPVTQAVPDPTVGTANPAYGDEFNGTGDPAANDPAWSWVRTPDGSEAGGTFNWVTQSGDLYKDSNSASVLLRNAPGGNWTVETKVALDTGTDTNRNFQQAGLVVYVNDNEYLKLVDVANGSTRRVEYGKETPGGARYGSTYVGPPAAITWLRIQRTIDPNTGEQLYRAATSRDGQHWIWGGVWTMPAGTTPRVGLVSMAACCAAPDSPQTATSQFDYFQLYQP